MKRIAIIMMMVLAPVGVMSRQESSSLTKSVACAPPKENCMGSGCERGEPVIFGKPFLTPAMRIRLLDKQTGKSLTGIKVTVRYLWEWAEYPYPEHPFGAWSEESYSTSCATNNDGFIEVSEFNVVPHGWYEGKYSSGHRPRFKNVDVGYQLPKCYTYSEIDRAELVRCRRGGKCDFTFKVSCE